MKDLNEILSHVNAIRQIDEAPNKALPERRRALSALAWAVYRELVAGRTVPAFEDIGPYVRIPGFAEELADVFASEQARAINQRAELAERLEADGGENGAKAAAILRAMNAPADSKAALLRARDDRMERYRAIEAARRERSLAKDAEQKILTAELRGFQKARLAMLRSIIDAQDSDDGLTKKQFSLLMRFKSFVATMQFALNKAFTRHLR